MAEQMTRQYIFTEEQTRFMFIGTGVMMVATIVGILLLAYSRPQGRFSLVDRSQYLETVQNASETISTYRQNPDGSVTIPVEGAMELVVERGVAGAFGETTAPTTIIPSESETVTEENTTPATEGQ
ncbi:MAG: hypothetical protein ACRCYY_07815 [Trueperaceae bacterium]